MTGQAPGRFIETSFNLTATDPAGNDVSVMFQLFSEKSSAWNDTIIFWVTGSFYVLLFLALLPFVIIFRHHLGVGEKPQKLK